MPLSITRPEGIFAKKKNHQFYHSIKTKSGQTAGIAIQAPSISNVTIDNLQQVELLVKMLQLKAYSPNTIRLYKDEMMMLIKLLGDRPVQLLKKDHIKSYVL